MAKKRKIAKKKRPVKRGRMMSKMEIWNWQQDFHNRQRRMSWEGK